LEVIICATEDYSDEEMHPALDIHMPNDASAPVTTTEIVDSIPSLRAVAAVLYPERRIDHD
jgi:hypothetical protein